jgi:hypothetical protein
MINANSWADEPKNSGRPQARFSGRFKAPAQDPNHLADELKKATDEYARLVCELNSK